MNVKYAYLKEQFKDPSRIIADLEILAKEGDFTLGKRVEDLEKRFSNLLDCKYAVGVSSGSAALYLSLKSLQIDEGEVITAPNTFFSTVNEIVNAGAKPVFVDIGEDYNINPALIQEKINEKTKAIMPVHLTGRPAKMNQIMEIARKNNLIVIEDSAQAIGASLNRRCTGTFGDSGCFSLHPLKNVNVWGDAGMIVTNNDSMYEDLLILRNNGLKDRDTWQKYGNNLRIATLQAVVGLHVIENFNEITGARIENARYYDEKLSELKEINIPIRDSKIKEVFHTYVIRCQKRDSLHSFLQANGIESKVHYPIPLHLQPATRELGYRLGDFPEAEKQANEIISLPIHQYLKLEEKEFVVNKIKEFYS